MAISTGRGDAETNGCCGYNLSYRLNTRTDQQRQQQLHVVENRGGSGGERKRMEEDGISSNPPYLKKPRVGSSNSGLVSTPTSSVRQSGHMVYNLRSRCIWGENSRTEPENTVVLQVYQRRRSRHTNEIDDMGSSNSSSANGVGDGEEESREEEPKKEEERVSTSSVDENPQLDVGGEMEENDMYGESYSAYRDFDDFKLLRKIELNQIWALNNGDDWAPRSYARINKFLPDELKVEVVLLDPHPTSDEDMTWSEKELPVACGTFKVGNSTVLREFSTFSHRVGCEEGSRDKSFYKILPRKGEIWAIYKDWSVEWTHSDFKNQSDFKMVEIMSDFSEDDGMLAAALIQADGCLTIFQRQSHEGFGLFQCFSRKDLIRFSHRILAIGMTGDGSWLMDPAIVPIPFNLHLNV